MRSLGEGCRHGTGEGGGGRKGRAGREEGVKEGESETEKSDEVSFHQWRSGKVRHDCWNE